MTTLKRPLNRIENFQRILRTWQQVRCRVYREARYVRRGCHLRRAGMLAMRKGISKAERRKAMHCGRETRRVTGASLEQAGDSRVSGQRHGITPCMHYPQTLCCGFSIELTKKIPRGILRGCADVPAPVASDCVGTREFKGYKFGIVERTWNARWTL